MISVLRSLESKLKTDTKQAHSKNDRRHGHEESWGWAAGIEYAKALGWEQSLVQMGNREEG